VLTLIYLKLKQKIIDNNIKVMTTILNKTDLKTPRKSERLEIELLICCTRTQITEEIQRRIEFLVQQEINWEYLIQLASRHQVTSLLYHNLNYICSEAVPSATLNYLRGCFQINTQRNLLITSELIKILKLFQDNNIYAIPFKGMTLAISAYRNLAFRQSGDLDILVEKNDLIKAKKLLDYIGYESTGYLMQIEKNNLLNQGNFLQAEINQKGYDLIHKEKKIAIDLQWSVTARYKFQYFPLRFKDLQKNPSYIAIAGKKIPQFSSENMLLYLCFHGSKHCWQSLKWICDLNEFICANPNLDWQKVETQAKETNCETMLLLGLFLVRDFFSTPLPESLSAKLKKGTKAYSLYQQVCNLIFERPFTQLEDYVFIFKITDSWRGKWQFFSSLIFLPTAKEWEFLPLPKSLFFLYYLIRPFRLVLDYSNLKQKKVI
jgi:hypothetical protein